MNLRENVVYKTRNGKRAKVVATGLPNINGHTVVAVVFDINSRPWAIITYKSNGQAAVFNSLPDPLDIVGYWAPVKLVKKQTEVKPDEPSNI
jgi:hypothetical protein